MLQVERFILAVSVCLSVCVLPSECDKVILLVFIYLLIGRTVLKLLSFEPLSTVTPCLLMYVQAGLLTLLQYSYSIQVMYNGVQRIRKVVCVRACVCVRLFC
jgi:hypothetical protein